MFFFALGGSNAVLKRRRQNVYACARTLKSDDGENVEYDRTLDELIAQLTLEDIDTVTAKLINEVD